MNLRLATRAGALLVLVAAALFAPGLEAAGAATVERRVLVIPVVLNGVPLSGVNLAAQTFGAASTSLRTFVERSSSGRATLVGTVAPTRQVSVPNVCTDQTTWFPQQPVPPGYDHYVFVSGSTCGSNWGYIYGRHVWINGDGQYAYAIRHEFGHNLGNYHTTNPDPYDAMDSRGCDYQAANKARLGWLDDVVPVTTSGTYQLTATNAASGRVLRIQDPTRPYSYWVEVRDWTDTYAWDGAPCISPPGVAIRSVPDAFNSETTLLYSSAGNGYFRPGEATMLPNSNIQVCVDRLRAGEAFVRVSFSGGGVCNVNPNRPSIATSPESAAQQQTTVTLSGIAPGAALVALYANPWCSGPPMATVSASQYATSGFVVPEPVVETTSFSAFTDVGGCSDPAIFEVPIVHVTVASGVITVDGTPGADIVRLTSELDPSGTLTLFVEHESGLVKAETDCTTTSSSTASCVANGRDVEVVLGDGDDTLLIDADHVAVTASGDAGDDTMIRSAVIGGSLVLHGGLGDDVLRDGAHSDRFDAVLDLRGEDGNDTLSAGAVDGSLWGGRGDDTIEQGTVKGSQNLNGGSGVDTVSYAQRVKPVRVRFGSQSNGESGERDWIGSDMEHVVTGSGNDRIQVWRHFDVDNRVDAGAGNDTIKTYGGNDVIDAGSGNDRIYPGKDSDEVDGGPGFDRVGKPDASDVIRNVP